MIGSRVSHYRIVGRFGGEGAGVYRAEDLAAGAPVLLHFVAPGGPAPDAVERFRRAALSAAALSHPNIAAVQEIGDAGDAGGGRLYLALPLFEGESLESLLARGPVELRTALDLAAQIAAGLARAHSSGITHGGLRPSCILVTSFGEVKVAAFGLGELMAPAARDAPSASDAPSVSEGGAAYCAPEVLGGAPPGPRSDVWSLGVILHEMIAGRHPFAGDDDQARIAAILGGRPEPLRAPRNGFPKGLERAAARCLAHRPDERYPDAGPLETDLLRSFDAAGGGTADLTSTRREVPVSASDSGGAAGEVRIGGVTRTPAGIAGRKLPSYRIFERLGSGGMAVVYRAEDIRLERTVALKFLAPELSRDPGSKARFLREARSASALDHPNLCTIHEIGSTEDGQIFIAMPYYGGETLAQRIARGPLPVDQALDIALQVAQGLAKAHRHGIVHRDIKPANLMLTPDGVVKIVDFGLAKLMGTTGSRSGLPAGTIDYISPEQAQGDEVDPRTDLWSLGVVLYEMLTGRRPFGRDHEQAALFAILREAPEPLSALRPDAPPALARAVDRLLEKDRARRPESAEAALAALRSLRGPDTQASRTMIAPPIGKRRRRWRAAGAVAGVLAAVLLLAVVWRLRDGSPGAPIAAASSVIIDPAGRATFPSLSRDAGFVVYALEQGGSSDIYRQRVGGSNPQNLTADSPAIDTQPAISPDGSQIVFRSEREGGGLFLMGATGEPGRCISDFGYNPSWAPGGSEVACSTVGVSGPGERGAVGQLWRIEIATGARRRIATGDAVQPSWSPNNLRIAYWGVPAGTSRRVIWTVPADGGEPVAAVDDGHLNWSPAWSPDGRFLYFASNRSGSMSLWRIPMDESSGRPRGAAQPITAPTPSGAFPSISGDGRHIVFATENHRSSVVLVPFDPVSFEAAGTPSAVIEDSRVVRSAEMSPDGAWIAFDTAEPQEDLFLVRPDGTGLRALTSDPARDRGPHWSGDGRRLLFYSDRSGRYEAWTATLPGGALERLAAVPGEVLDPLWSPDGHALVFSRRGAPTALLDLGRPPAARVPTSLSASFAATSWSPDGAWLAGTDRTGIVLYSFTARRLQELAEQGSEVAWLRDGRTLLFLRAGAVFALDRLAPVARRVLDPPQGYSFERLSIGPGDRTLVLVRTPTEGYLSMLTLR